MGREASPAPTRLLGVSEPVEGAAWPETPPVPESERRRTVRIYWYWPVPHLRAHPWPVTTARDGDHIMVHSLQPPADQAAEAVSAYEVRRDLPRPQPVNRSRRVSWYASRSRTHWRRAYLRERAVREGRYDLCHIHHINRTTDWWAIPRLRRLVPVVLTVHDVVPHVRRLPERLERRLLARAYRAADRLVVYHETLRSELTARFGIPPDNIAVIPHPIRTPGGVDPKQDGDPVVLFFGTFRPNKGIDVLLEAIAHLSGHRETRFVFVGAGEPTLEQKVRQAAERDHRISHEIRRVSNERRDDLIRKARLLVLPYSDFHSQSGVLADAYSFGRPVVVTDVGALGPTVRVDGSGWVARPNDPQDLARQLDQALRDREARSAAARAALRAGRDRSYEVVGHQLRRVYERVARA